jgi:hypothetical protein
MTFGDLCRIPVRFSSREPGRRSESLVRGPIGTTRWMKTIRGVADHVLANLIAAIPGRIAARTPTALLLRAE